jgi:hypothetical protein
MSATLIPLMGKPFNVADYQTQAMAPETAALEQQRTAASAGLIGQQAQAAQIANTLSRAQLGIQLPILGQVASQINGGQGGGIGGPGAAGPNGLPAPATSSAGVNIPALGVGAVPIGVAGDLATGNMKKPDVINMKRGVISQVLGSAIGPNGEVDPDLYNQNIDRLYQMGWMDGSDRAQYEGHPERAVPLLNSFAPVQDQPAFQFGVQHAKSTAEAQLQKDQVYVPDVDESGQPTGTGHMEIRRGVAMPGGGGQGGGEQGGIRPDLSKAIDDASNIYGVPSSWLRTTAMIENPGGNPNAVSPTGARGDFQFTGATAANVGLANPTDPKQAARGAARNYLENKADLSQAIGRTPTPGEMYIAHQQGPAGAAALLQADPNANAVAVYQAAGIPPRNLLVNGATPQMTVGQFLNKWESRFSSPAAQPTQVAGPGAPPTVTPGTPPIGGGPGVAAGPPKFTPGVEASQAVDTKRINDDAELNQSNLDAAQKATTAGIGIREARDLVKNVPTGAFIDQRMGLQSIAQQTNSPLLTKLSSALTGLTPTQLNDAEFARKLYQNNVVAQEQAVGNVRIGAMFTNFFAKASPNLSLQNGALNEMTNAALVGQQMIKDFANGSNDYVNSATQAYQQGLTGGKYQPYEPLRHYESTWLADNSPHSSDTYAAAVHILNGAPVTEAFKGLTPVQRAEAVSVISRADPSSLPGILQRPDVIAWRKSLAGGP